MGKSDPEDLSDNQKYDNALEYIGTTKEEVEKKKVLSVAKDTDVSQKVTELKTIVYNYRMILEGRTYVQESGGYVQEGSALAGRNFIALSSGILGSYADESNLLTQKDFEKFALQFIDAFEKIENMIMRDRTIGEKDSRPIFKLFKDSLMNLGDIITGSKENMKLIFQSIQDKNKKENDDYGFG